MDKIAIIGAGKIAYSLSAALIKAGYDIDFVLSRSESSAKTLAKKFKIKKSSNNYSDIGNNSKIFFLCVPDNQIKDAANCLSQCSLDFHSSIFIHLSGSQNISPLNQLSEKGAGTASFHIMQTFPSKKIVNIENCFCAVETVDIKTKSFLYKLAKKLKLKPFQIDSDRKIYYHIAGVFVSNFLIANLYNALTVFRESLVKDVDFVELMEPILKSTVANTKKNGISKALSGPVDRGDTDTIIQHLNALAASKLNPEMKLSVSLNYILQSLSLLEVSKDKYGRLSEQQEMIKSIMLDRLKKI